MRFFMNHITARCLCIGITALAAFSSCNKMLDVGIPKTSIASEFVFKDQPGAEAAIAGMYSGLYNGSGAGSLSPFGAGVSLLNGLLSDELTFNGTTYDQYKNNSLVSNEPMVAATWKDAYGSIYRANAILENVDAGDLTPAYKNQAMGEALFVRAFCHFYLVNLYGDVPLMVTTRIQENQVAPRTATQRVNEQVVKDLEQAVVLLPNAYFSGTSRVRVNKAAATAFLARVYLYMNDYANAEANATKVINDSAVYRMPADLNTVFLNNSTEAIFSFAVTPNGYTLTGMQTVPNAGVAPGYIMQPGLLSLFEANDKRKAAWVAISAGSSYPNKYKTKTNVNTEYEVVLRLAEQYLIRAEARARRENLSGAQYDLNRVRFRAGLGETSANTQKDLLTAIAQERRVELFAEWAHRWLDLKRTGEVDAVMKALKPTLWESTDAWYPIPSAERTKNVNLSQNLGYN